MATPKTIKPQIKLFTLQELQRLALLQILADSGVEDPVAFLEAHEVDHMSSYKASVLAIAVNGSSPKEPGNATTFTSPPRTEGS
jgi:hypothetical protein